MFQFINSIVLILILTGCTIQNKIVTLAEIKLLQIIYNDLENKYKMDNDQILSGRQYWNEIIQQRNQAYQRGNYLQGIELSEKAYQYAVKKFGKNDKDTLTSINNLAVSYRKQGKYTEAELLYKHCLQLREKVLGQKHPDTIISINNLALLYYYQGRYVEAEPLYKRCLQLSDKVLRARHPDAITYINNIALLYHAQGRYFEAESQYLRCLQLSEKILPPNHPNTLTYVTNLATLYQDQGRYSEAVQANKRCLKIREDYFGSMHPETIISINNLALLYYFQGKYIEADPLYKRCLQLSEKALGAKHPDSLTYLNNLALLFKAQGRYPEAESLSKRCVQLKEEVLGPKHPDTIRSINNLALVYQAQGRYPEADVLYKKCLQLREEVLGPKHPDTLISINNLASLYNYQGKNSDAETLYKRCHKIRKKVLGPKHPDTLESIGNLASSYRLQGKYSEAEPLCKQFLKLSKKVMGPKHPYTITGINNLAILFTNQGRYLEAEQHYKRCLQISREIIGVKHPYTLSVTLNFAKCLFLLNQKQEGLHQLKKMERSLFQYTAYTLQSTQKFRVRKQFMLSKTFFQDVLFTVAFQSNDPEIKAFAGDVIFRWKCMQEEAETTMNYLIHFSKNSKIKRLGQAINNLRRQMNVFDKHVDLSFLTNELEQKELELARLSKAYDHYLKKGSSRMINLSRVLPPKTAVIELKQYQQYDLKIDKYKGVRLAAALVLPNSQSIIFEDLGKMKDIVLLFESIRSAKSQKRRQAYSKKLYDRLFGVLDKHIKQAENIYIAPDGLTHKIAFSRLILPDGRFWIERQNLCRIQTSRDLLDPPEPINQGTLVAMGGIDYDQYSGMTVKQTNQAPHNQDINRSIRRTAKMIESFVSLPSSKTEVEFIKMFYELSQQKTPLIFRETSANEYQLKHLDTPPHVLHLATHGFFLESSKDITERPMLLSGLAFAGSNLGLKGKKGPGNDDGILFAIEVSGLNLTGTELVVLSACDTGIGIIDKSEGIYGLLRSFRLAGAQNIIITLWSLNDQSAKIFFSRFYKTWLSTTNMIPSKALRETQLGYIKENKDSTLWAPYVLVGGILQ